MGCKQSGVAGADAVRLCRSWALTGSANLGTRLLHTTECLATTCHGSKPQRNRCVTQCGASHDHHACCIINRLVCLTGRIYKDSRVYHQKGEATRRCHAVARWLQGSYLPTPVVCRSASDSVVLVLPLALVNEVEEPQPFQLVLAAPAPCPQQP